MNDVLPLPIVETVGAACFIDQWRYVVASPLAVLTADDVGVRVGVRRTWYGFLMKRGMWFGFRPLRPVGQWEATWDDAVGVRVAGDTVVLENAGRERCRFCGEDPRAMARLVGELRRRSVKVQDVRSTFWDVFLDRHWAR